MNPYGFRELKRPRYYWTPKQESKFPRKVGVCLALGVLVVGIGLWWASKV